jgi:hypothetical protein
MFNYEGVIGYYEKLFGKANVFVIPFELLKKDPHEFVRRAASWVGVSDAPPFTNGIYNQGYGGRQIAIARFLNRFLKSKYRENGLIPDVRFPLTGKIDAGKLRLILQSNISRKILGNKPITDSILRAEVKRIFSERNKALNQKYDLRLEEICPGEYFDT